MITPAVKVHALEVHVSRRCLLPVDHGRADTGTITAFMGPNGAAKTTLTVNFQTVGGLMIHSLISNPAAAVSPDQPHGFHDNAGGANHHFEKALLT